MSATQNSWYSNTICQVAKGGTGQSSFTDGQLLIGNSTGNTLAKATLTAPAAGVTITGGAGTITFALADDLAGVEALATTGLISRTAANTYAATSVTQHAILIGAASEVPTNLGPLTNGQLVIGSTGNAPVAATLTAGVGVALTNAAGSITISAAGGGLAWSAVTIDASFTVNTGTVANKAGLLTMTLPATAVLGDTIRITGINTAVGWRIAQNANQQIHFGNLSTTAGVGGYLEATAIRDSVELVCVVAGASTEYNVISSVGNITIT